MNRLWKCVKIRSEKGLYKHLNIMENDNPKDEGDKVNHLRKDIAGKKSVVNQNAGKSECWKGFALRTKNTKTLRSRDGSDQQPQHQQHPKKRKQQQQQKNQQHQKKPQHLQLENSSAKGNCFVYKFMKDLLRLKRKLILRVQDNSNRKTGVNRHKSATLRRTLLHIGGRKGSHRLKEEEDAEDEETKYIETANIKIIQNDLGLLRDTMQDIRLRVEHPNHGSPNHNHLHHPRPVHLFTNNNSNLSCDELINIQSRSPSSEEDNSPTEMNNCRRLAEKPPLVKRLTMGLLRSTEECRPLVHSTPSPTSGSMHTISDGYVNEGICDPEKLISSKFGDSCRQSLTSILDKADDFDFKKKCIRETSSANSSPKIFAPTAPLRFDGLNHSEQTELKGAAWYQAGIPREISLEVLSRQSPGAFLVRQSSTKPGCFALSLRVPPPAQKVAHYLILRTPRGYKIKGFTKEFSSLRALITHHSVMPELLPVPLTLPRPHNQIPPRRDLDDFDTYGSLSDFRKMMADLNV